MNPEPQPAPQLYVALTSELLSVRQAAERMRSVLAAHGCGAEALAEIELCVVEAMNNVVEHGYGLREGHPIELSLWWGTDGLVIELRDQGSPIPEEALASAALPSVETEDLQQLPDRGWGLGLLHELMDEVRYEARAEGNLLRLVRRRFTSSG